MLYSNVIKYNIQLLKFGIYFIAVLASNAVVRHGELRCLLRKKATANIPEKR